jgi:2-phosphosulfolactate phosphatase
LSPGLAVAARQSCYDVRFDWGLQGLDAVRDGCRALVIVDVLRFTSAVSVAVSRGATVIPYAWARADADEFAAGHDAELAGTVRGAGAWSLSPTDLQRASPDLRLVLPSPNGAALAAWASDSVDEGQVAAACLRNAGAAGTWLADRLPAAVVAAGERWADGSLRPGIEDLIGAGAVLAAAAAAGAPGLSPEARAAVAVFEAARGDLPAVLADSVSGRELADRGWADDVETAAQLDADAVVPVLDSGAFVAR